MLSGRSIGLSNAPVTNWSQVGGRPVELKTVPPRLTSTLFLLLPRTRVSCMATENNPPSAFERPAIDKTTAEKRRERASWVLDDAVYSVAALLLAVIVMHS